LKPGNILLSNDKKLLKICDFGISKQRINSQLRKGTFVGTPWYMAPEIIEEKPYSFKADVWSFGCCVLHMATGEKPFKYASPIQVLHQITSTSSPIVSLSALSRRKIYKVRGLSSFLRLCFKKDPEVRSSC